jgi:hypothetical protein
MILKDLYLAFLMETSIILLQILGGKAKCAEGDEYRTDQLPADSERFI